MPTPEFEIRVAIICVGQDVVTIPNQVFDFISATASNDFGLIDRRPGSFVTAIYLLADGRLGAAAWSVLMTASRQDPAVGGI